MLRNAKLRTFAAAALVVAGCARSDFGGHRMQKPKWRPVRDHHPTELKQKDPPRILPETHLAAGDLLERQGALDKAVMQYRKAIAVQHNYAEAYHRLGVALGKSGRHDEAVESLNKAIALKPDNPAYRNNLGFQLILLERWSEAEQQLRRTLELSPDFDRARVNLAIVVGRQGRFDESLGFFLAAMPEGDAYYNLGLIYRGHKRYDDAALAFQRALSFDPAYVSAQRQLNQLPATSANTSGPSPVVTTVDVNRTFESDTTTSAAFLNSYEPTAAPVVDPWSELSGQSHEAYEVPATDAWSTSHDSTDSLETTVGDAYFMTFTPSMVLEQTAFTTSNTSGSERARLTDDAEQADQTHTASGAESASEIPPCDAAAHEETTAPTFDEPSSFLWPREEFAPISNTVESGGASYFESDDFLRRLAIARNEMNCWEEVVSGLEWPDAVACDNPDMESDWSAWDWIPDHEEFEPLSSDRLVAIRPEDTLEVVAVDVTHKTSARESTALTLALEPRSE